MVGDVHHHHGVVVDNVDYDVVVDDAVVDDVVADNAVVDDGHLGIQVLQMQSQKHLRKAWIKSERWNKMGKKLKFWIQWIEK